MNRLVAVSLLVIGTSGCATMLTSEEKQEYQSYQAQGIAVQVKNPAVGAVLGILPGCGSFYARAYGWGVVNLLMWPFSMIWDPVSGYEGSIAINYYATQAAAPRMAKDLSYLDDQLNVGLITEQQYSRGKQQLVSKYASE